MILKKLNRYLFFVLVAALLPSINIAQGDSEAKFEFDHFVIFTRNNNLEDGLRTNLLTQGEKLTTVHQNQGTEGHYFLLYNTFIEFLHLKDVSAAKSNTERFKSRYTERYEAKKQNCPFAIGLTLTPFDTNKTSFPLTAYHSLDSPKGEYYLMSESNTDGKQPLIYISAPNRAYHPIDSIEQVDELFEPMVQEDFRSYLSHPSGIKRLTKLVITVPEGTQGANIDLIQELKECEVKAGKDYGLTLIFDEGKQGKEISFKSPFEVVVRY